MTSLSIGLGLTGCSVDPETMDASVMADAGITYARNVKPLFERLCVDCHYPGAAIDIDLKNPFDPAHGIIDRDNTWVPNGSEYAKIVVPGNPDASFLIAKVERTDLDDHVNGGPMPWQVPYLSTSQLEAVRSWIANGAQNDAQFMTDVAPIFGTRVTLGGASGRCTWCHYPGTPNGLDMISVFDGGVVNRTSRFGGKVVDPGNPDASVLMKKLAGTGAGARMPLQYERLTADEVAMLREWVRLGARND